MHRLAVVPLCLLLALILGSLAALLAKVDGSVISSVLTDKEIRFAVMMSCGTSLISLVLSIAVAVPAAWVIARFEFRGKQLINLLLDLPMVTPPLVAGMGLLLLLGNQGPFADAAPWLASRLFSPLGIIIAQCYVASSILARSAVSSFMAVDINYVHTAYNLGLRPFAAFVLVEIPLCWRQLVGGCVLALARCLGEFGATLMLAGATRMKTETLPMAVYLNISSGDYPTATACASLLLVIACALLLLLHTLQQPEKACLK